MGVDVSSLVVLLVCWGVHWTRGQGSKLIRGCMVLGGVALYLLLAAGADLRRKFDKRGCEIFRFPTAQSLLSERTRAQISIPFEHGI